MATSVSGEVKPAGKRTIDVCPSLDQVAARGATLFFAAVRQALAARGSCAVALSGGTAPIPLLRLLGDEAPRTGIDWAAVHVFWVDERCVAANHGDSNFRLANELFLSHLPLPGALVHRIFGELPPDLAADCYDAELFRTFGLGQLPVFDLILLGVGADGHTASLFPGMDLAAHAGRHAVAVYVEKLSSHRVTLTLPVLNAARQVLFLATGDDKAAIVAEILAGSTAVPYPAALVSPRQGRVTWLLDHGAAGELVAR